ncbi:MAG: lysophospholipid acyltransferase family protein [Thermoanaerobaculaceae bacterium]|nr:lysophospholipid acyltransferase family protein [Thermoanaerobaculaceae bacterium]TAM56067.1 MAG: lipid A biosynthesis acyltransferase [Acidobacteriota bacterium]
MASRLRALRDDLGYVGIRALLGGSRALPLAALRAVGRAAARCALALPGRDRGRARQHIAIAFSDRPEAWRRKLLGACAGHLGAVLGEVAWLWSAAPEAILARTEFVGLEHLTGALGAERGALLVTGHCGNWEWLNLGLGASGVPMTVAARQVYDPRLGEVARRLRGRFGGETALRGQGAGAKLLHALHHGRVIGLLIDQDIEAPGAFVEFFGRPAWTPTGAALLAVRTGRPIVTGFAVRLPDGTMRLEFDPPTAPPAGEDLDADVATLTAALTARIERQVRAHPEQWVWMHKRWRHQPGDGEPVWRDAPSQPHPAHAPPAARVG